MRDKERILLLIITRIIPGLTIRTSNQEEYVRIDYLHQKLNIGDLVFANTTIQPNEFMVGFVHELKENCVVIREIGSNKLCNYYNESFSVINKEKLGYEILEGLQYKIYQKVLKAFEYLDYSTRFRSINFSDNTCTVTSRTVFENDKKGEASFQYNAKTTIKEIVKILETAGV